MKLTLVKKWFTGFCLAGALLSANTASAILITPTSSSLVAFGNQTSQSQINTAIAGFLGASTEIYKQNVGEGFDTGSVSGSYVTTFSNSATDPEDALIDYIGGSFVGGNPFLLVKDGNNSPAWYLFNLTGIWNGGDDLQVNDFWVGNGAISHVALYGSLTQGTPVPNATSVPDGGATVALLGLALAGLATVQRFQNKK